MGKGSIRIGICAVLILIIAAGAVLLAGRSFSGSSQRTRISSERARQIALQDAGRSEGEVIFTRNYLHSAGGRWIYQIEFFDEGSAFVYEIDADTGSIARREVQVTERIRSAQTEPDETEAAQTETEASAIYIGVWAAQRAALEDAGFSADQVSFEKVVLDREDGRQVYDVHFDHEGYEYEYKIDAFHAAVLEKEIDLPYTAPVQPPVAVPFEANQADAGGTDNRWNGNDRDEDWDDDDYDDWDDDDYNDWDDDDDDDDWDDDDDDDDEDDDD